MSNAGALNTLGRDDSWQGINAVVAGFGPAGIAAVDNLVFLGANVVALDERDEAEVSAEQLDLLRQLGAEIQLGPGVTGELPAELDLLVVTSPFGPDDALVTQAVERDIEIWSDLELGWRLHRAEAGDKTPWFLVSGHLGAEMTAEITAHICQAAGLSPALVGALARPAVEIAMDPTAYDVVVASVDLSQLQFAPSIRAESAVVLSADPAPQRWLPSYEAVQGRAYEGVRVACVYNVEDVATRDMVAEADVVDGARAIGVTLGMPSVGMVGLVEDILVDRAFIVERSTNAAELATLDDLGSTEPDVVLAAIAAAALTRAHGVSQQAVRDGLRSFAAGAR